MVPSQKFNYSIVSNWRFNITLNLAKRKDHVHLNHVTAETNSHCVATTCIVFTGI